MLKEFAAEVKRQVKLSLQNGSFQVSFTFLVKVLLKYSSDKIIAVRSEKSNSKEITMLKMNWLSRKITETFNFSIPKFDGGGV